MLESTNDIINNIDKNEKPPSIYDNKNDKNDKNEKNEKNENFIEDILLEIKNLNNKNNIMRNNIESNNLKKRKLEKFLFDNCEHDFKFAYREPHERATYICIKCNCYDDKYYYQY